MSNRSIYEVRIAARVPSPVPDLLVAAATRGFISTSAYIRQALAEKLERDGFPVPVSNAPVSKKAA